MVKRLAFGLIALFWVAMNALLVYSEFGGGGVRGGSVPPDLVWEKILTAPDDSALEILRRGKKIGYCRWLANAGEELSTGKVGTENVELEGRVKKLGRYTADLEGSLTAPEWGGRFRFDFHGLFATTHAWRELQLHTVLRPTSWDLKASAPGKSLHLLIEDDEGKWERTIRFEEFRNPGKLLEEFGVPFPSLFLPPVGKLREQNRLSLGLVWEARHDSLKIGHSVVRAYRLEARLLDRYKAVVVVSRVGEILRVELPGEITLVNNALMNL